MITISENSARNAESGHQMGFELANTTNSRNDSPSTTSSATPQEDRRDPCGHADGGDDGRVLRDLLDPPGLRRPRRMRLR